MHKTLWSTPWNGDRTPLGDRWCRQNLKSLDRSFRERATWSLRKRSLQAIARGRAILLCKIWTALMLKRAIRFFESTHERDCRDLSKAEVLAALRRLHDQIVEGPPLDRANW
jgi:hypothetical protein